VFDRAGGRGVGCATAKSARLVDLFRIVGIVMVVRVIASQAEALGTIEGTITGNGAALSGAHVAVTGKGVNRMTTTDGSGLGLAIVETIAEAHEGSARAANAPGGGTDVWLALALERY